MVDVLGLDEPVATIYQSMVGHPTWGVADLAKQHGMTEEAVRKSLDDLFALGLVRASLEDPQRLRAVPARVGIQHMLAMQHAEITRQHGEIARNQAILSKMLAHQFDVPSPESGVQQLEGLDAIYSKLEQLAATASAECISVMPGGAQSAASLSASRPLDEAALARGVAVQTLYQDSVRNDPSTFDYARWLTTLGGEVRTLPVTPPRMVVVDRAIALVSVDPSNSRRGALVITSSGVIAPLLTLFDQAWNTAVPLGADREPDAEGLTSSQRELLRLQSQGLTDEACATRLGISPRTARRMMAELIERLGARSRFEAGLRAAQRGWL